MSAPPPPEPAAGLSIGEVARIAGLTPRAVRHYHATGLLPEPSRDTSGYRRYDASDVVAVVRVARLRALGMPIPHIASRVAAGDAEVSLPTSLRALAEDLDGEIQRLTATRDRLRELAESETFDRPLETLQQALRKRRVLEADAALSPNEAPAAALVDALHPLGMQGVLDQADSLLRDPVALGGLNTLLQRFRELSEASNAADIDALAAEVAGALPRPEHAAPPVDVEIMDKLLGDRLNPAQRRFMHVLRRLLDGTGA